MIVISRQSESVRRRLEQKYNLLLKKSKNPWAGMSVAVQRRERAADKGLVSSRVSVRACLFSLRSESVGSLRRSLAKKDTELQRNS